MGSREGQGGARGVGSREGLDYGRVVLGEQGGAGLGQGGEQGGAGLRQGGSREGLD